MPSTLRPHISTVWQVWEALTSVQYPLIKEVAHAYNLAHPDDDEDDDVLSALKCELYQNMFDEDVKLSINTLWKLVLSSAVI